MCKVASFKNFENSLTTVKVMTKNKVAPFYLGHGVVINLHRDLIQNITPTDVTIIELEIVILSHN